MGVASLHHNPTTQDSGTVEHHLSMYLLSISGMNAAVGMQSLSMGIGGIL